MKPCDFDERQMQIRGGIFQHMFIVLAVLIFVNAFLTSNDIVWTDEWNSGIIILLAATAAGSIEMIFREVYLGKRSLRVLPVILGIVSGLMILWNLFDRIFRGRYFIQAGKLTDNGGGFVMMLCIFSIFVGYVIKKLMGRNEKSEA